MDSGLILTTEMMLVLGLIAFTVVMFTLEWVRADVIALLILVVLGITSLVVSHEIPETFRISDQVIILANGRIAAQGTPEQVRNSTDPLVVQFVEGQSDGPVRFHYPAQPFAADLGLG